MVLGALSFLIYFNITRDGIRSSIILNIL